MSEPDILYPAIFVFSMMLIGLGLTIREFSRLHKREPQRITREKHVTGPDARVSRDALRRASSF